MSRQGAGVDREVEAAPRATALACAGLVAIEVVGAMLIWIPIPVGWMWVGARVYEATGSILADLAVVFIGFVTTTVLAMKALARLDVRWVELRRRAGHRQKEGALNRVVIVSAAFALLLFDIWFYVIERAFILPFMPTQ